MKLIKVRSRIDIRGMNGWGGHVEVDGVLSDFDELMEHSKALSYDD